MVNAKRSLIELRAYSRHGDIYRWLRENYERVKHETANLQRTWESIAADIASDGVKGMRGRAPYAESVRRIWPRVCRDVEADRERQAQEEAARAAAGEKRRSYPSRMPQGLRPRVADQPVRPVPQGQGGTALVVAKGSSRALTEEEEQKILAERLPDGRLTPAARALKIERARRGLRKEDLYRGA
jgi:hypothetical protein